MPNGIEVAKDAIDQFQKFNDICCWQEKKMQLKHMKV